MAPTPPDFSNVVVPFDPVSFWQPGEYDPAALVDALKQQPALADFDDNNGRQSAVRLDPDEDPANVGYWVSVPDGTAKSIVDAGVAAYTPPTPPEPPPPPAADTVLGALAQLDPATATVADVVNAVKQALKDAGAQPA